MLRHPHQFAKLFRMPLPRAQHFDHYLRRLSVAPAYSHFTELAVRWAAFEAEVELRGESVSDEVYRWEARAIQELTDLGAPALLTTAKGAQVRKLDHRTHPDYAGERMISFDLVQANFSALRAAGLAIGSWLEFAQSIEMPAILAESKVLRQRVFGHLMPSRQQGLQAHATEMVVEQLHERRLEPITWLADEVVVIAPAHYQLLKTNFPILPAPWSIRKTHFQLLKLPDGGFKRLNLDSDGAHIHTDLFGVRGDRFYLTLSNHVLKDHIFDEDREFEIEGRGARWLD